MITENTITRCPTPVAQSPHSPKEARDMRRVDAGKLDAIHDGSRYTIEGIRYYDSRDGVEGRMVVTYDLDRGCTCLTSYRLVT